MSKNKFILSMGFLICVQGTGAHAWFTKKDALSMLKTQSPAWSVFDAQKAESKALEGQAQAALKPQVSIISREFVTRLNQIEFGFESPGPLNIFTFGSTGVQMLYSVYDKMSSKRIETAETNSQYVEASARQKRRDVIYLMFMQFLNVQRLERRLRFIDETIERDQKILGFAKMKVQTGAGIKVDLMRARSVVNLGRFKKAEAELARSKAYESLASTLGQSEFVESCEPFVPEAAKEMNIGSTGTPQKAASSLDYEVARKRVDLANSLKEQYAAESNPKFGFFGNVGVMGTHAVGGFGSVVAGTVGIQLQIPIFDGSLTANKVAEASAKVLQAEVGAKQALSEEQTRKRVILDQLQQSQTVLEVAHTQKETSLAELDLSQKRFAAGATSGLELFNSQASLSAAMDNENEALFAVEAAKLQYLRYFGNLESYAEGDSK